MVKRAKSMAMRTKLQEGGSELCGPSASMIDEDRNEDDSNVAEMVVSNKGGPKLIHRGFMYTLHKKQSNNIRWRCVRRTMYCRGSVVTTMNCMKPRLRVEHNHKPDFAAAQVARRRYQALGKPRVVTDEKGRLISSIPTESIDTEENNSDKESKEGMVGASSRRMRTSTRKRGTAAPAVGRLVLVSGADAVKLTSHRLLQEQRSSRTAMSAVSELKDGIRLEGIAMKQEPEDDEECYLDEGGIAPSSPTSGRHSSSTHRVRSHARSLRAMANPSAVWAHFDLCANDPLRAQCRICGAVVVRGGANPRQCGTTNLHRHLRVHHGGRLIGRRYHVLQSASQSNSTGKTIRIAAQSLVRPHIRNIAPAPLPQQQQQQQRQPKTLVLKTIPLKVKQVAPTTIKMPPRQTAQGLPQNIVHQQPTEVCLRWNSYHSNMQNSFPSLLDSEQFVDVTLACEGRSLKCHKMILSSCSDYLAELLRENPCQHPIILMKDLKFWEVEALVKFMYRGEVNVAHDKLPQLLNAAEALQVKGLAGPSPSSQNPKPPMLIPQSKPLQTATQPVVPRIPTEAKEKPSSSGVTAPSSPKRAQKRQQPEPLEPRPFTKIRLQRPPTPTSPCAQVKMEPLDIPLSPTEIFPENNDDSSNPANFEKLMSLHEDDDPGGDEANESERDINFCEISGAPDLNDAEDQMEFVPTDFLDQEQDIVEETENVNKDSKDESTDHSSMDAGDDDRGEEDDQDQCSKDKPA